MDGWMDGWMDKPLLFFPGHRTTNYKPAPLTSYVMRVDAPPPAVSHSHRTHFGFSVDRSPLRPYCMDTSILDRTAKS